MLSVLLLCLANEVHGQGLICDTSDKTYTIGDEVRVCLFFFQNFQTYGGVNANIPLDQYGVITADRLYETITNNTQNQAAQYAVQAKAANSTTSMLPYIQENLVGRIYNVVILLKDGSIDSIEWDNSCEACDECLENETGEVCSGKRCGEEAECDPLFFVSWMGTDEEGSHLTSASYRISQFRKYSLYGEFNDAKSQLE